MKIQVTQGDIDNGVPNDRCNCPVARAIQRVIPPGLSVYVYGDRVEFFAVGCEARIGLPYVAKNFIEAFDNGYGGFPEPIEFEIADITVT